MALSPEQIGRLEVRAHEVGERIGWDLAFRVLPNPEYVTVTAAPTNTTIMGPSKVSEGAVEAIRDVLARLEQGALVLATDEDGAPFILARIDAEAATQSEPAAEDATAGSPRERLDLQRLLDIVGDAMVSVQRGYDTEVAAIEIIAIRRPTLSELAAARQQNQELNGGLTPDALRGVLPPTPVPEEIVRLRRMIDDVLVAAQRQLEDG